MMMEAVGFTEMLNVGTHLLHIYTTWCLDEMGLHNLNMFQGIIELFRLKVV
jgi:hypothetical protein